MYPFCFLPFLDLFLNKIGHHIFRRIELVSIWWPPILRFLVIFFFTPPTEPKPGNIFDAKRTKRGWPQLSLMVSFCFVFFSFGLWNKLKLTLFKDPLYSLWRFSSAHKKKVERARIYWPQRHWGGVRARYFASVHSCAVKWSRKTKGKTWTDYSRLDIKHLLRWELSSLPVHGVDSRCWRQCTLPGHVSQEPFHSYEVHRHVVNRAINDILHKNKGKIFPICPAPYPPKSPTGPF